MNDLVFTERIASHKTEALFLLLMALFLLLMRWRVNTVHWDIFAIVFAFFFVLFLFYSINYRILVIHLTAQSLMLKFGIFTWAVFLEDVADCRLDEISGLMRMGGAGIHFMTVNHRYRASFNFLEYPRVAIALKSKRGPVQDISFSTRRPEEVIRLIKEEIRGLPTPLQLPPAEYR
jgi:hypothetical protein